MINPAAIPQIPGDMAALSAHATTVAGVGTSFADTGRRVNATWQGLTAVYTAPEAAELFAATGPVQSVSASVGEDVTAAGTALGAYATEVTAIKARLETLRAQATTFVDTVADDDDWRDDEDDVRQHNQLISDVNTAVADFMDAQRRCANTILALYTDHRYTAENGDGTITEYEYGYTADQLDTATTEDGALPWGTAEEHDRGLLGDVGAFFVGIKDGAVDMVVGLGALIGYSDGTWSWDTAGTAWTGLGTFVLALSVYSNPLGALADQTIGLPGFDRGELGDTLLNAGKAIIAYDTWGEDPARAAGMTTFNIVSAVIGTKGAGAGLRGGGAALEASRFATVARAGTGVVRAGEFLGRLPTIESVLGNVGRRVPGLQVPHIDLPDIDVPTTRTDAPPALVGAPHVETPGLGGGARASGAPPLDPPGARADVEVPNPRVDSTPDGTPPQGVAPDGTVADGSSPDGSSPDSADPGGPALDADPPGQTPDGDGPTPDTGNGAAPGTPDARPPGVPEVLVRDEPLPTQELDHHYRGENDPDNPNRAFYPDTVEYMSPEQLAEHRVVAIGGQLHWASDGSLFDTSTAGTVHSGAGRAMFVMDEHGNLYASLEQRVGELHHSSFLGGRPVAGAGEIAVQDGVTTIVSRKSGHYQPTELHQQAVRAMLAEQGVDVSAIRFESGF